MLRKEIKEDLHKRRDILYSQIGSVNIEKMSILSTLVYRFNALSLPFDYMAYSCTFLRTKRKHHWALFPWALDHTPLGSPSKITTCPFA